MDQPTKDQLLTQAREHIANTQAEIATGIAQLEANISHSDAELRTNDKDSAEETKMIQAALLRHTREQVEDLKKLHPSPYFTRCDMQFSSEENPSYYYFAKFSYPEASIYSWTTPLASIRFEEPGPISYHTPEEGMQAGNLLRRDQYMIVDGNLNFFASEGLGVPRELIYQEYLSNREHSFALPEIVAQMERAQDQVIRAHHAGPFVISGPAGSGKTTLALHRVAYLTQSPDTANLYPSQSILVFVQDNGTKDYFSHLLPELGIHNVRIVTFSEWAIELLSLEGVDFVTQVGSSEAERDRYGYQKLQAIRNLKTPLYRKQAEFRTLERFYQPYFTSSQNRLFQAQVINRQLDHYDLTILLQSLWARNGGFTYVQTNSIRRANGQTALERRILPLEYSLLVVDEFQNYLPEQLQLYRLCAKKRHRSILYVGDMAQQTQFGTIHDWGEISESIHLDRTVRLHKVYRNTRQILEYIQRIGYPIEVPHGVRQGPEVREAVVSTEEEAVQYVREVAGTGGSIGILAKNRDDLAAFRQAFSAVPKVHCLSIREAQGVEFDVVCLVGISAETFKLRQEELADTAFAQEKEKINRDLLYVALTRAISELHVIGSTKLKTIAR